MKLNSECALAEIPSLERGGEPRRGAATVGTVFAPPGSKVVSLLLSSDRLSTSLRKDINSPLGRMCSLWSQPSGDLNLQGGEDLFESLLVYRMSITYDVLSTKTWFALRAYNF